MYRLFSLQFFLFPKKPTMLRTFFGSLREGQFAAAAETAAINSSDVLPEFYRSQVLHVEERGSFQLSHRCGKNDFSDCVIAGKLPGVAMVLTPFFTVYFFASDETS